MTMPTLFALPGTLLDERSLQPVLRGWRGRTQIELLGSAPTLDAEVDRLAALASAEGSAAAPWWLGHSLGGIVALRLAQRHPEFVGGLVLLAANARAGASGGSERRAAQWALAQQHGLQTLATEKLAPTCGVPDHSAAAAAMAAQAVAVGLQRFEHQLRYQATRPGLLQPRHPLQMPVLLLSGEHDRLCPPADSVELLTLCHRGAHRLLAGADHLFPMQQPRRVAAALRRFAVQHGVG